MASTKFSLELLPLDVPSTSTAPSAPSAPYTATLADVQERVLALEAPANIDIVPLGRASPKPDEPTPNVDRFLREATRQYAEGHLDPPLWDRAFAQANSDKDAATEIYLRSRATALHLLDRERRTEERAAATQAASASAEAAKSSEEFQQDGQAGLKPRVRPAKRGTLIIGGTVAFVMVAAGLWILVRGGTPATDTGSTTATSVAATAMVKNSPVAAPARPAVATAKTGAGSDLMKKIQELRDAGNWNVLVLYLVEWTRLEPANPVAWNQLRAGYMMLKQYDDARAAAKKAVELAPEDPTMLRGLGAAEAALDDPAAALRAFEQAASRDEADTETQRQIGLLNAQLGHPQEAKGAFDRVLAANPGDAVTLCLRTEVAQMPAVKGAYALAQQVGAIDRKCRGT